MAAGAFDYRIRLQTHDEMSELAGAMNDMTARFQAIRDNLDRQVRERTKQVVRSEQLASVGFLAAGVAHEINNPLASIAMCAESLEGRIREVVEAEQGVGPADCDKDEEVISRLLAHDPKRGLPLQRDHRKAAGFFADRPLRAARHRTAGTGRGVIDMLRPLGPLSRKTDRFGAGPRWWPRSTASEIKQVVLNLLTNALDSVAADGTVRIRLDRTTAWPN